MSHAPSAHPATTPKAVIVVSSHVVRGSVGNRAAVFALETLGNPVWAVPTVILPWHPGHGRATRIVLAAEQFAALMHDLESAPWLGEVAGVLSGYLGDVEQVTALKSLVSAVRTNNPNALYVCDPVMGDLGGLYVKQELAERIRDELMPIADIATPNRYELAWMVGRDLPDLRVTAEAASEFAPTNLLVTSAPAMMKNFTGNLLISGANAWLAEHHIIPNPPNGLGDLTGAVFLARLLAGQAMDKALQTTTAAVFEILARTTRRGGDELQLETDAQSLSHPMAMVQMRRVSIPGTGRRA
ncbi:MAG: pyridoxal kinase PdxY [Rhizobiaceae bacterium]|nr:pyridoxal kinase PdxY [Rhizobiaceae bacterium]